MINDLIHYLLPAIEHFRVVGYWIAFFDALLETTVGIGLILPGSTLILFLGAFSASGYLDVGDLIWFVVMGAIIGDNLNYYLGKKYGARWLIVAISLSEWLASKNDLHLVEAFNHAGWKTPDKLGLSSFIRVVKASVFKKPYPLAPISPSFWNTSIQDFNFTKPIDTNRLSDEHHLRIWRTKSLLEIGRHIYVGMANAISYQ
jgi:hypothetical protein